MPRLTIALRGLTASPAYTAGVVAVLGLALACTATVHAVIGPSIRGDLPYPRPASLFLVHGEIDGVAPPGSEPHLSSSMDLRAWRAAVPKAEFAAVSGVLNTLGSVNGRQVLGRGVGPGFLATLGGGLALGRDFVEADFTWFRDTSGVRATPMLVTHWFWRNAMGGDVDVVRRPVTRLRLAAQELPVRVVGVLSERFVFPFRIAAFQPDMLFPLIGLDRVRPNRVYAVIARLPDGESPEATETRLRAATLQLAREWPAPSGPAGERSDRGRPFDDVRLWPLASYIGSVERPTMLTFAMAAALVMVMALVSAVGLAASRAYGRARESSIRVALGARRRDFVLSWLGEAALVALGTTLVGLAALVPMARWTVALLPESMLILGPVEIDGRVVAGLVAGAAVASLIATGIASLRRPDPAATFRRPGPALGGTSFPSKGRHVVLGAQVAVCLPLLTAALLMMASLYRASARPPGFELSSLATIAVNAEPDVEPRVAATEFAGWLAARPGVKGVAGWTSRLFGGPLLGDAARYVPADSAGGTGSTSIRQRGVTPEFFSVMDAALVNGRLPAREEWRPENPVALVNRTAAERFWPDGEWIGRRLDRIDHEPVPPRVVIGVVEDALFQSLDEPAAATILVPSWPPTAGLGGEFLLRTDGAADRILPGLLAGIQADGRWRVAWAGAAEQLAADSLARRRLTAWLFGAFGAWAILVFAAGTAGVLALQTRERLGEFAVRVVLGATTGHLVGQQLWRVAVPVAVGVAAGTAAALAMVRRLEGLLFETAAQDPWIWASATAAVLATAAAATLIASRPALRLDPAPILKDM
jgi:predicted permease